MSSVSSPRLRGSVALLATLAVLVAAGWLASRPERQPLAPAPRTPPASPRRPASAPPAPAAEAPAATNSLPEGQRSARRHWEAVAAELDLELVTCPVDLRDWPDPPARLNLDFELDRWGDHGQLTGDGAFSQGWVHALIAPGQTDLRATVRVDRVLIGSIHAQRGQRDAEGHLSCHSARFEPIRRAQGTVHFDRPITGVDVQSCVSRTQVQADGSWEVEVLRDPCGLYLFWSERGQDWCQYAGSTSAVDDQELVVSRGWPADICRRYLHQEPHQGQLETLSMILAHRQEQEQERAP